MKNSKKVISFILTLMLVFGLLPIGLDAGVAEVYAGYTGGPYTSDFVLGNGTSGDPYQIDNSAELTSLGAIVNGGATMGGIYFKLMADVSIGEWTPIGNETDKVFSGNFDGNSKIISGLTISTSAALTGDYQGTGFFGFTSGASIHDLNLDGVSTSAINCANVGGLVGSAYNTTITGVTVSGTVKGMVNVGGLVGYNLYGSIETSSASGIVTATSYGGYSDVGGLVGDNEYSDITSCHASVDVTGDAEEVGGLIGYNYDASIETSSASGIVTGDDYVGGLVGCNDEANITDSYATGDVIGHEYVGGLAGYNYGYDFDFSITDSYATGDVTGTYEYVGGLVGYNEESDITNSYASGNLEGGYYVGGLVGTNGYDGYYYGGDITKCYATGAVNSTSSPYFGGLVGYNNYSDITESYATGTVSAINAEYVGGLVGYLDESYIVDSYATGTVTGYESVGGLAGYIRYSNITSSYAIGVVNGSYYNVGGLVGYNRSSNITSSYANGDVTGDDYYVGGLVGYNRSSNITSSYASGSIDGNDYVGGLVGYAYDDSLITSSYAIGAVTGSVTIGGFVGFAINTTVSGCFWDKDTSDISTDGSTSSTGLSTAEMKTQITFTNAGWDFTSTWAMGLGVYKYPVFQYSPLEDPVDDPEEEVPVTNHHHRVVMIVEPLKNLLRFNIGNIDSFLKLGTSTEELKPMDVAPILFEGRTFLPIRFVVEPLGGAILWNEVEQKVTITMGDITIELWIGNNVAKVNGIDKVIDTDNALIKPFTVYPGRTMLPLRFISEALGCTVDWDAVNEEILVSNW